MQLAVTYPRALPAYYGAAPTPIRNAAMARLPNTRKHSQSAWPALDRNLRDKFAEELNFDKSHSLKLREEI